LLLKPLSFITLIGSDAGATLLAQLFTGRFCATLGDQFRDEIAARWDMARYDCLRLLEGSRAS
jgi:hypothetical protein